MKNIMDDHRQYDFWIIYILTWTNHGWARLFGSWYGIAWKHKSEPLLFSERIGKTKLYRIGKWNVKVLLPALTPKKHR